MRILLIESSARDGADVARVLRAANHDVDSCYPATRSHGPCVFLTGEAECPLLRRDPPVDVVVDARRRAAPVSNSERGAVCAIQHGTPLVVVGPAPARMPWDRADVRCEANDVVDAVRAASAGTGSAARAAVRAAVGRVLIAEGLVEPANVWLERHEEELRAHVELGYPVPELTIARRVREAAREALGPYLPGKSRVTVFLHPRTSSGPTEATRRQVDNRRIRAALGL